jgi:hypothetical protein
MHQPNYAVFAGDFLSDDLIVMMLLLHKYENGASKPHILLPVLHMKSLRRDGAKKK